MKYLNIFIIAIISFSIVSCDLEQEVEVVLPEYEERIFLECYLQPGEPLRLLLTKTSPYFAPFPSSDEEFINGLLEQDATVSITYDGEVHELDNTLGINFQTSKIHNYSSDFVVPEDFENEFELSITTADGETITGSTKITELTPIDSIVVQFSENDTLARVLTFVTNDLEVDNYFRTALHVNSLDSIPDWSFPVDDRAAEEVIVFGTFYDYAEGDTIINTVYSIEEDYFEFLQSMDFAVQSNGNPFAQPSPIVSNIEGTADAIGIFTGFTYDRRMTIIEK